MIKRMIIMLVLCGLVFGGVFGYKMYGAKMMMAQMALMGDTAQTVSTIVAEPTAWQDDLKAVGSLRAAKGADIAPEVAGTVKNIFMESGQDVTEGMVLAQLDSAEDYAKLQSLIANLRHAEITLERDKKQIKVQAISQATFDADIATYEDLKAQVEEQKAVLEKKTIVAPFSGRLGIRQIDVGQYLNAGTTIVNLQQMDPIYFDFYLPQQNMSSVKEGQKVSLITDAVPGKTFEGTIKALEAKVDENTRNIAVRATFANPDKLLRPGMYATATIV
ncbi:MAG: efflux RND transporter periplasmic adaptor subunit, partial [Bdellovibrionales bacterium]